MIYPKKNKFTVAGNCKEKETDSINSIQLSLKSQSFGVTLYTFYLEFWHAEKNRH